MTPGKNNKGPPQLVPSQTAELQAKKNGYCVKQTGSSSGEWQTKRKRAVYLEGKKLSLESAWGKVEDALTGKEKNNDNTEKWILPTSQFCPELFLAARAAKSPKQ